MALDLCLMLWLALPVAASAQAVPVGVAADADVWIEQGTRETVSGDWVAYLLLGPSAATAPQPPPYPVLILNHGFVRDYGRHIDNAWRYARAGLLVLTPNLAQKASSLPRSRALDVADTLDHLDWLEQRSSDPDDSLYGFVDAGRIALAGHSAGGGVALEAAAAIQAERETVSALVLLDAVPAMSTMQAASRLAPLDLMNLRAEPGPCNANGSVDRLIQRIRFEVVDLKVVGAGHCDPESPTDVSCELACGRSIAAARQTFVLLTEAFLVDRLGLRTLDFDSVLEAQTARAIGQRASN